MINETIYANIRRHASRFDQDWEDKVQDAAVFLMEHDGTVDVDDVRRFRMREGLPTDDLPESGTVPMTEEHAARLGSLHVRGGIRNIRRGRAIHQSLTDAAAFAIAERATAIRPDTTRAELIERINGLPLASQEVCRLLLMGYTQAQIATKLAINASTLRWRIRQMRRK